MLCVTHPSYQITVVLSGEGGEVCPARFRHAPALRGGRVRASYTQYLRSYFSPLPAFLNADLSPSPTPKESAPWAFGSRTVASPLARVYPHFLTRRPNENPPLILHRNRLVPISVNPPNCLWGWVTVGAASRAPTSSHRDHPLPPVDFGQSKPAPHPFPPLETAQTPKVPSTEGASSSNRAGIPASHGLRAGVQSTTQPRSSSPRPPDSASIATHLLIPACP